MNRATTAPAPSTSDATPLIVSPRGQITLPKPVRARLRLTPGSVLLLREEGGRILLDPAAVTAVEHYSDEEIARLLAADRVTARERTTIRRRWSSARVRSPRRRTRG
jgi:AbrB family looped-hinge helix DNA binding protein